ncbi:fibrinogen-like protein A [Apostichopus japonicus]|uniref:fibrinogen-like protein A n=1 Tax=Stichopus japonicus TaxID=307972 RepID=UPI003AB5D145
MCSYLIRLPLLVDASLVWQNRTSKMMYLVIVFTVIIFSILADDFLLICDGQMINPIHHGNSRVRRSPECNACLYYQEPQYPRDCEDVYNNRCEFQTQESGVYMIQPDDAPEPFNVFCNNSVDGGKWTVFQRRVDGAVDFYRNWNEYKHGFGFLQREFWLGNDNIAYITNQGDYELRIDLVNTNGNDYFAKYDLFRISDEETNYRMVNLGEYQPESTASTNPGGNQHFVYHRNLSFTTFDRTNDIGGCENRHFGGWWYKNCEYTNLNGLYFGCDGCYQSIEWRSLPGGCCNIRFTEMKLRRISP